MTLRILIALGLTAVLALFLQLGLDIRLPGWAVVAVYLLLYFIIERRDRKRETARRTERGEPEEPDPDYSWLPTSGPIGRFGQYGLMASFFGNHVVIRHAETEYGLYAHLIRGSIEVQPGDQVQAGQPIGRCGHSGHSTEPHLHFHIQDSPDLFKGMGLPLTFHDIEVDGVPQATAQLTAGQRVVQLSATAGAS